MSPPLETPSQAIRESDPVGNPAPERTLCWTGAALNWSGYAQVTHTLLPELVKRGLNVGLVPLAPSDSWITELKKDPAMRRMFSGLVERRENRGLHVAFHPAADYQGRGILSDFSRSQPGHDAYVGMSMFETDRLPWGWAEDCNLMDEVWVPSTFNVETFARAGVDPGKIRVWAPGIEVGPPSATVTPMRIPERKGFAFLSIFEWTPRKAPDLLIRAFIKAFQNGEDVCLIIRASLPAASPQNLEQRVRDLVAQASIPGAIVPRIIVLDRFVPPAAMPTLYAAADAFVLPSRGEGFGLPYLEAMAAGLPVIGTRWSGQLDFMTAANSYLIDVKRLVPVGAEQTAANSYYEADHLWAEPSTEHLVALMRDVFLQRAAARGRGERARREVADRWTISRAARDYERLHDDLLSRTRSPSRPRQTFSAMVQHERPWTLVWYGPVSGIGDRATDARRLTMTLDEIGVPVAPVETRRSAPKALLDPADAAKLKGLFRVSIVNQRLFVQQADPTAWKTTDADVLNIGRTFCPTYRLPAEWVQPCLEMTELWVPTHSQIERFQVAGVPRAKLVEVPACIDRRLFESTDPRPRFEHARGFNFFSAFDFMLGSGWDILLRAYFDEFDADADVALVLAVHSTHGYDRTRIHELIEGYVQRVLGRDFARLPDLTLLFGSASSRETATHHRAADAFVLPDRLYGPGYGPLEASASGTPAIVTRGNAATSLALKADSLAVPTRPVDVPEVALRETPSLRGCQWMEPSLPHLRRAMRLAFEDRTSAKRDAESRRPEILRHHDCRRVAAVIRDRVEALVSGGSQPPSRQ